MRTLFSLLPLLLTFFFRVDAQSIVLCESYDTGGKPSGVYSTWDITSEGGYIYMLYSQPKTIEKGTWYIYVDYDWDKTGELSAYHTLEIKPEAGKNWFVYDNKFTEAGKYRAMVMRDGTEVASTDFVINIKGEDGDAANTSDGEVDTYYYENSSVQFCTSVDASGNPDGVSETFSLGRKGSVDVTIYVENAGQPFKTTQMQVDIYKDEEESAFDAYTLDIQAEWDYMKFTQTFTKPGSYYVDLYNGDDVFVNTGTVTITR